MARIFRRWRFQSSKLEMKKIDFYLEKVKLRNMISSRINYEKRKVRLITKLQMKMTKIKLRNYFIRYWKNAQ
jgi:hypothetical protein